MQNTQSNQITQFSINALRKIPIVLLLIFTSIATWDIVAAISPTLAWPWLRPLIAVIIGDGGFLYWEWRAKEVLTEEQRFISITMQFISWLYICAALIADGLYHQTFVDIEFPIWAGYTAIYAPLVTAMIFLIGHALIVWYDPTRMTEILTNQATQEVIEKQNAAYKRHMQRLAPALGNALAVDEIEDRFRQRTGRGIEEVLPEWSTTIETDQPVEPTLLDSDNGQQPEAIEVPNA